MGNLSAMLKEMQPIRFALLAILVGVSLLRCASSQSGDSTEAIKKHRAIIFVPGFYGSGLADAKTGDRVFLTFGQALWGKIPLALNEPDLGVPESRAFKVDGLLKNISIVPALYAVDAYGGSLDFLQDSFGHSAKVVSFPYDWRKDVHLAVKELAAEVRQLQGEGFTSIALVAHSFGGIVVSYYLRYGEQDFEQAKETWDGSRMVKAVVLAGVPFRGAMTAFRNVHLGTSLGLAKTPLSAVSLSTFPAMYQLMPSQKMEVFLNRESKPVTGNVYDPKLWVSKNWGLSKHPENYTPEVRALRTTYSNKYLIRAERLRALIDAPPNSLLAAPKIPGLSIRGKGIDTLGKAIWSGSELGDKGQWYWQDESAREKVSDLLTSVSEDGDGTVTFSSSATPEGLKAGLNLSEDVSEVNHQGMYANSDVQKKVTAFLHEQGF